MPAWALALTILGWVIVAVAAGGIFLFVVAMEITTKQMPSASDMSAIMGLTGMAIWLAGIGGLLVIAGRSRRPDTASGRLKLWARFAIIVGILFSVGVPVFIVGMMLEPERLNDPVAVGGGLVIGGVGLALGLVLITSALIWGRRKKAPDVAHVFS